LRIGDEIKHTSTPTQKILLACILPSKIKMLTERFVQGCSPLPIDNHREEWILENCDALTNGVSVGSERE
jgi:hypothetical protein